MRPADMTERQLVDAMHAVSGKLCRPELPDGARRLLERHADRMVEQLSLRDEDRRDLEEQRRVDAYLDERRGA